MRRHVQYQVQHHAKKSRHKWLAVAVLVLLLFAAGLYRWATASDQGQIASLPPDQVQSVLPDKTYSGKYMTFRYSSKYLHRALKPQAPDLELAMLTADTPYDKHLAVSVSQLTGGNLNSNSAYNLRRSMTNVYASYRVNVDDSTAIVWVKNDGSDETVFIPHGQIVAMLSFSTTNTAETLQPEVDALLPTFHWK